MKYEIEKIIVTMECREAMDIAHRIYQGLLFLAKEWTDWDNFQKQFSEDFAIISNLHRACNREEYTPDTIARLERAVNSSSIAPGSEVDDDKV